MRKLSDIELHDAQIDSLSADYPKQRVTLAISYYASVKAGQRSPAMVVFSGVEQINQIIDFKALAAHRSPGNVVYWQPAENAGTSFFYLANGLLSITAKSVKFRRLKG